MRKWLPRVVEGCRGFVAVMDYGCFGLGLYWLCWDSVCWILEVLIWGGVGLWLSWIGGVLVGDMWDCSCLGLQVYWTVVVLHWHCIGSALDCGCMYLLGFVRFGKGCRGL